LTTPSKSPPASELSAQGLLFQVKEIFALAAEQDEYLMRDQDSLELEHDAPRFLQKWNRANPDLSPETVARMWREPEDPSPQELEKVVLAVQRALVA